MKKYSQIIFVCTGNTCRSPMAEALLKEYIGEKHFNIISRGLTVFDSSSANEFALRALKKKDINMESHRAKLFDMAECGSKTLVLTMTSSHKNILTQHGYKGDLYSIKEFMGIEGEVKDPYGGDMATYRKCADELERLIIQLGGKIL